MRALQHDLQHDLQWMGREAAEDTPVRACMPSAARPSPHAYWGYTQSSVASGGMLCT